MYFLDLFPKLFKILDSCLKRKVKKKLWNTGICNDFLAIISNSRSIKAKHRKRPRSAGKSLCSKENNKWV